MTDNTREDFAVGATARKLAKLEAENKQLLEYIAALPCENPTIWNGADDGLLCDPYYQPCGKSLPCQTRTVLVSKTAEGIE